MPCMHLSRSWIKPWAACVRALSITETPSMKAHASPSRARERIGSPGRDRRSCHQNSPGIAAPVHPLVRDVNFKWILNSRSVFLVKRNRGRSQQAPRSTRSLARRMSRSLSDALGVLSRELLRSVFFSDATSLRAKCAPIAEHRATQTHWWARVRHIPGPVARSTR